MKKRIIFLFSMVAVLFGMSLPIAAQDDTAIIPDGYYYVYGVGDEGHAWITTDKFLSWQPLERANPRYIFRLIKNEEGPDSYYMQSLYDSLWFCGVTNYYCTEFRGIEDRQSIRFVDQGDGTYKSRPLKDRFDMVSADMVEHNYFQFNGGVQFDWSNPLAQWNAQVFYPEPVPEQELLDARIAAELKDATDAYTKLFSYTIDTEKMLTNAETEDEFTGLGSQFFCLVQRTDDGVSKFANLIDGNNATWFQTTWDTEAADKSMQWLQVDLGEGKASSGFQLQFGIRDGTWGSREQWLDISVYGSNNESIALDNQIATRDDVNSTEGWNYIGDYLLTDEAATYFETMNPDNWPLGNYRRMKTDNKNIWISKDINLQGQSYRYIRFFVNMTPSPHASNMDFTIGDLQIYNMKDITVKAGMEEAAANLLAQLTNAKAKLLSSTVTEEDIANLAAAINGSATEVIPEQAALQALLDSITSLGTVVIGGNQPGNNDPEKVAAYEAALSAAKSAVNSVLEPAQYTALRQAVLDALEAAKSSIVPVASGYYNIVNAYSNWRNGNTAAMIANFEHKLAWTRLGRTGEEYYLFKITDLGDGTYSIQNVATGEYAGTVQGQSQRVPTTSTQEVGQTITSIAGTTQFNIANTENSMAYHTESHNNGEGPSGLIVTWNGGANSCSAWNLIPVTDQNYIDSLEQVSVKTRLIVAAQNELAIAQPLYEDCFRYDVDYEKGLITNADDNDEEGNQVWGTQEPSADYSSYAHLIDGDLQTCFQSTWSAGVAAPPQWLQVDLREHPVQNFQFYFGLRNGNWGAREQWSDITLYATNEESIAKDENITTLAQVQATEGWEKVGDYSLPTDLASSNYNGTGRFFYYSINRMAKAYRFLRFYVNSTYEPQSNMMYTIGEFQIYENALNQEYSPYTYLEGMKDAADKLKGVMDQTKAAILDGTVTEEMVNNLIEARKAVEAIVPKTDALDNLIAEVKSYVNNYKAGTNFGDVSEEQWSTMQNAIGTAEAYDHDRPMKDDLKSRYDALETAFATFKTQQIQFEPNKWYYIVSQDQTRQGYVPIDGVGSESNIYDTKIYGNVIYSLTANTSGGWGAGNKNALRWGYYDSQSDVETYSENIDPNTMWRFVPIEGEEGQYAIQNRASGRYMNDYANNSTWIALTTEPKGYKFELLGSGQYSLVSARTTAANNYFLQLAGDGYLYSYGGATKNNQAAFTFEAVPDDDMEVLQLQIPDNNIQFMALPYAFDNEDIADFNADLGITTYAVKSYDGESGTLYLTEKKTFEAGEPFLVSTGDYTAYDPDNVTKVPFAIPVIGESYSYESKTVNGLTSVMDYTIAPKSGLGFIANAKVQETTTSTELDAFSAYLDPKAIVDPDESAEPDFSVPATITGVKKIVATKADGTSNVYTIDGKLIQKNVTADKAAKTLKKGLYIIGKKKVAVK